jgi:glycosyltransferase involved in cell wall biosynthesis
MNIIHIVNSLECGGLENFAIDLSLEQRNLGHTVHICCLEVAGNLAPKALKNNTKVHVQNINPGLDLKCIWRLMKLFRHEKADVVHTHNMKPLIHGTLAAKLAGVKTIVHTKHGRSDEKTYPLIWNMNKKIISISEDTRSCLLQHNNVDLEKTSVIPNGIPINSFAESSECVTNEVKNELNIPSNHKIIGIVARLAVEKDHSTLLNSFALIAAQLKDVSLVIVGDGPLIEPLKEEARKLNITERTYFLGFRTDISRLVSSFDVFVLSSISEGMSLTLLEAMAAKKPIVATNVGGNPEVVLNGESGLIVDAQNPSKMASALVRVLEDSEFATNLGKQGFQRVNKHFSVEEMTQKYLTAYES